MQPVDDVSDFGMVVVKAMKTILIVTRNVRLHVFIVCIL